MDPAASRSITRPSVKGTELPEQFDLGSIGWGPEFQSALAGLGRADLEPGRVTAEHRGTYDVMTASGEKRARLRGKFMHESERGEWPAVGDWVALEDTGDEVAMVEAVLPRRSRLSRKVAGDRTEEQVVAANLDNVFVVEALDTPPNLRRIERFLTVAWESGAEPVVILTKSDLSADPIEAVALVSAIAPGVAVHAVSPILGEGRDEIASYLGRGRTVGAIGPSGAGKSTLANFLLGEELMDVQEVRADGKGRHTTVHRQLLFARNGGAVLDSPGMRELQLWGADEGLDSSFEDIAALAEGCRFRDCAHMHEPGCAVLAAVESGELPALRLESYRKQLREVAAIARKRDKRLASEETKKWKSLHREAKTRARIR
jgi:ribosome biogenesis GTPase